MPDTAGRQHADTLRIGLDAIEELLNDVWKRYAVLDARGTRHTDDPVLERVSLMDVEELTAALDRLAANAAVQHRAVPGYPMARIRELEAINAQMTRSRDEQAAKAEAAVARADRLEQMRTRLEAFAEACEQNSRSPEQGWLADYSVADKLRKILALAPAHVNDGADTDTWVSADEGDAT